MSADTPDWYKMARDTARKQWESSLMGKEQVRPSLPLEQQLTDAISALEREGLIAKAFTLKEWDAGCDTAVAIAEIATRIACIANLLVIERVKLRSDWTE